MMILIYSYYIAQINQKIPGDFAASIEHSSLVRGAANEFERQPVQIIDNTIPILN